MRNVNCAKCVVSGVTILLDCIPFFLMGCRLVRPLPFPFQTEAQQLRSLMGNVAHDLKTPLFSLEVLLSATDRVVVNNCRAL